MPKPKAKADPEAALPVEDDHESMEDEEDDDEDSGKVAAKLLRDPAVMAALQGKLNSMVGTNSGYIQSLPASVKRRLKSLKKLQFDAMKIEAKFYEEIHELEMKYQKLYDPLFEQRGKITKGDYEPKDEECEWPSDSEDEDDEELAEDLKDKAKLNNGSEAKKDEKDDVKGIPEFWLTIFKNVDMVAEMIQEHDEPVLQALQDVTVTFCDKPMGFSLHFFFGPNEYFTNTVLTKEYGMKCEADQENPFSFEGPEIVKAIGCKIDWKEGKNLTVKTVKKKQKHKQKGNVRTIKKTVKNDSFFNFFDPPAAPEEGHEDELDEETQELLTADFEIGHYIRERIIPKAVLYFTGEALEDDDFDEEEEDEDDDDEDGEEEEDEDPDFDPSKAPKGQNPQECKQQ